MEGVSGLFPMVSLLSLVLVFLMLLDVIPFVRVLKLLLAVVWLLVGVGREKIVAGLHQSCMGTKIALPSLLHSLCNVWEAGSQT